MTSPIPASGGDLESQITATLSRPGPGLRFPPALEARFEADTGRAREDYLFWAGWIGLITYDGFLPIDRLMLPDVFGLILLVRGVIITPLAVAALLIARYRRRPWVRELIASATILTAALSIVLLYHQSEAPTAIAYRDMVTPYIVFANVVLRLRVRHAIGTTLAVLGLQAWDLTTTPAVTGEMMAYHLALSGVFAAYTLFSNYQTRRSERTSYLLTLRETLRGTDLAVRNAYLLDISSTDGLTGLANRREFDRRVAQVFGEPAAVGVLLIDIDHFKAFNDTHGHLAGDDCLRRVARELSGHVRDGTDLVARYGGEEFAVILPAISADSLSDIAERMRAAIEALGRAQPVCARVTVSVGVARAEPARGDTPAATLERADIALYEAKRGGRNTVAPLPRGTRPRLVAA